MQVPGVWGDVVVKGGRFKVITCEGDFGIRLYDEDGTKERHIQTREGLWWMRAASHIDSGDICAIGQGQQGGPLQVVVFGADGTDRWFEVPGLIIWGGPAIESLGYAWHACVLTTPTTYMDLLIFKSGVVNQTGPFPVPVWPGGDGSTANGFLGFSEGRLMWTDPNMFVLVDGMILTWPHWAGGCTVAQMEGGVWWSYRGYGGKVIVGNGFFPHVAEYHNTFGVVARQGANITFAKVVPPYPTIPPPPPPPPVDPPVDPPVEPPVEPPMSAPNHLPTVEAERAKYPKDGNLGPENAWKIINAVAYIHRDEGWGLRRKREGQNHNGFSIDVIIHRPTGEWYDILGSSETLGIPQWGQTTPAGPTEDYWAPPIPPEQEPDDPIDPPGDDLKDRVRYLEQMVKHIITHLRAV